MNDDLKYVIKGVVSIVILIVCYNIYDGRVKLNAYNNCMALVEKLAREENARHPDNRRILTLPTCYTR